MWVSFTVRCVSPMMLAQNGSTFGPDSSPPSVRIWGLSSNSSLAVSDVMLLFKCAL